MLQQKIAVEGRGMIEVDLVPLFERKMSQIAIIAVLLHQQHIVRAEGVLHAVRHQRFARAAAAADADEMRASSSASARATTCAVGG